MDLIHSLSQPRHSNSKSSTTISSYFHHNSQKEIPSARQSSATTQSQRSTEEPQQLLYSVEPKHIELKPDKISGKATATFSIQNYSTKHPCTYSLFSAHGRLKFSNNGQGSVSPGERTDIVVQLRSIFIRDVAVDTALVLVDGKYSEKVKVTLPHQFRNNSSNDPDCPMCALERKCLSV